MKLTPEQRVDLPTAKRRALQYLARQHRLELIPANAIAIEIWPTHQMTSQGSGAAASRVMKHLAKDGHAEWTSNANNWGYRITQAGLGQVGRWERGE